MVSRVQTLRSSTAGARPANGTRAVGELYVNYSDNQLGVIDTTQTARDLLAVRVFNSLASYAIGQYVWNAGLLYRATANTTPGAFNPAQWSAIATLTDVPSTANFLPLSGGTMTGPLIQAADPVNPLGTATKQYVDAHVGGAGTFLPLAGGTMTGAITLPGDPASALQAATKQYVDAHAGSGGIADAPNDGQQYGRQSQAWTVVTTGGGGITDAPSDGQTYGRRNAAWASITSSGGGGANLFDNGAMTIVQRGGITSIAIPVNGTIVVDRWAADTNQANKFRMGPDYNGLPPAPGFPNWLGMQSSAATTPAAADYYTLYQALEGDNVAALQFGTTGAKNLVLSFWAAASVAGIYSGSIENYAGTRSYVFTFNIPTINVQTFFSISIPGDTAGTWISSGNQGALFVNFDMGSGTNHRTATINSWIAGDFNGQTGSVRPISTNGAKFSLTGVKLEIGTIGTPFVYDPVMIAQARCQRYYIDSIPFAFSSYGAAGSDFIGSLQFPVYMRDVPTTIFSATNFTNANSLAVLAASSLGLSLSATVAAGTAGAGADGLASCSAEL